MYLLQLVFSLKKTGPYTIFCKYKGGAVRFTNSTAANYTLKYHGGTFSATRSSRSLAINEADVAACRYRNDIYYDVCQELGIIAASARKIKVNTGALAGYNQGMNDTDQFTYTGNGMEEERKIITPFFCNTPVYTVQSTQTTTNTRIAYNLSTGYTNPMLQGFKKGNYLGNVSDNVSNESIIQEALWLDKEQWNEGISYSASSAGTALYNESDAYEKFVTANNLATTYDASINTTKAQVVANRNEGYYIIGPYTMTYPDDSRFSYVEDMYIVTDKSSRVEPLEVIFASKNANKPYPSSGETFYVKFSASGHPSKAGLHIDFAYLQNTTSTYERLTGSGSVFRYVVTMKKSYAGATDHHKTIHHSTKYGPDGTVIRPGYNETIYTGSTAYYTVSVSMNKEVIQNGYTAQVLARRLTYNRVWQRKSIGVDVTLPGGSYHKEDLTIELGGYVWLDARTGKESQANGSYENGEKRIPNVLVTLYRQDGTQIAQKRTDSNGNYKFTGLDAMYQYYVKFTYNGQFYQPTVYSSSGTWQQSGWSKNSNATDKQNERVNYNAKFAEVSSDPSSYVGSAGANRNYTKQELLDAGVIDEYGNLINESKDPSMVQFVRDCLIDAYTGSGNGSYDLYPVPGMFVVDDGLNRPGTVLLNNYSIKALYDAAYYINLGLDKREEFDLALRKDVSTATIEINGKGHTYTYDTRSNADETDDGTWDIGVRLSDAYYNTKYSREVFGEDYQYKASNYGDNAEIYGKTKEDELNVYVTYKLTVRNQSQSILGQVTELVDYYDEDYEYIDERSYIEIKLGNNKGKYPVQAYNESRYGTGNSTDLAGYDALYVRGLQDFKLTSGQTAYVYLTFKIKKDNINGEDWIRLDETVESAQAIGVGKENIAEINGFKTFYASGTFIPNVGTTQDDNKVAGLFDRDSTPGNLSQIDVPKDGDINYNNFEDDTDKAPNIRLILYRENGQFLVRSIDGVVWEDERTEDNKDQITSVGDGIRQDNEQAINGVTVQLVELMDNGTEYVWKEFSSGQNYINENDVYTPVINLIGESGNNLIPSDKDQTPGKYIFKSYMPGNYVVRFIYGDTIKTVLPNTSTDVTNAFGTMGQNAKSYNGQDYKSTTYQEGITQNKEYVWRKDSTYSIGQETLGEEITRVQTFKADASNNQSVNATINAENQQGYLFDITASDANANVSDAKDIMSDTNVNVEYGRQNAILNSREDLIDYSDKNVMNYIAEVLASHEQMPLNSAELSLKLDELMKETQMTAETGLINVELEYDRNATAGQVESNSTSYTIHNVNLGLEQRPQSQLAMNKQVTNVKLTLADGSTLFDASQKVSNVLWRDHKPYTFKYNTYKLAEDPMSEIREKNSYDTVYGLTQLTMDEELMHGATIKISYKITVTNVGEVDYKENSFYYTGTVADKNTVVKTRANQLVDYVANNLQFYAVDNEAWQVISQEELLNGPVNMTLANQTAKYNTVITTTDKSNIINTDLLPAIYDSSKSSASDELVLTQLITSENDTDDLTYRNIVEIVRISNDVGRRNAYSVVGNQNPTEEVSEVDTDVAQIVRILPPYGSMQYYIAYVIAAVVLLAGTMLIVGIVFIKKRK